MAVYSSGWTNNDTPVAGISLDTAGPFTVRGLAANTYYRVVAWRDQLGATQFNYADDPYASTQVYVAATSLNNVALSFSYPSATTLTAAPQLELAAGVQNAIGVLWSDLRDSSGNVIADQYSVQCSSDSSFTTVTVEQVVTASEDNVVILPAAAGTYFCRIAGLNHGATGPYSSASAAVVVPASGGSNLGGTVSNANLLPSAPLDLFAYSGGLSLGGAQLAAGRSDSAAFSLDGLTDATGYITLGWLDTNANGQPDPDEPATVVSGFLMVETGADAGPVSLAFASGDAVASAPVDTHIYGDGGEAFGLSLNVVGNLKQPVNAALQSASDLDAPVDLGLSGGGFGPATLSRWFELASAPSASAQWSLDVQYADGNLATLTAAIPELLLSPATPYAVQGGPTPTFSWLAPASPPTRPWSYGLQVDCDGYGTTWRVEFLAPSATSMTYGQSGSAYPSTLPAGARCTFSVSVRDSAQDRITQDVTFTVPLTVSITPSSTVLNPGQSQQFAASVGGSGSGVSWSVQELDGGIDATGLFTAPASSTDGDVFHVVATAVADPTVSATATVTISSAPQLSLSISPATATLGMSQVQQFAALAANVPDGGTGAVSWTVFESDAGTVDANGLYTAPAFPGTFHVLATSQQDSSRIASATVLVKLDQFALVELAPRETSIAAGGTLQLGATVTGATDTSVQWSTTAGSIDATGLFTAPYGDGDALVTATSNADPTAVGYALVHFASYVGISVSPSRVTLLPGESDTFTASLVGPASGGVTWSVTPSGAGSIDQTGAYVAPSAPGTYGVVATSNDDPTSFASAAVTVVDSQPTLSGIVSYDGGAVGRIVITASSAWGQAIGTTSRVGPGAFTIHGLTRFAGPYFLTAWLDTADAVREVPLLDPAGALFVDGGNGGTDLSIALEAPASVASAPSAPTLQYIESAQGGAVVHFSRVLDASNVEQADHYTAYVLDPGDGTVLLSRTIGAWAEDAFYLAPLPANSSYDVVVTATAQGHESALSGSMKLFVGGGGQFGSSNVIQGSVDLGTAPQPGILWVRLSGTSFGQTLCITRPAPQQSYAFTEVPDGTYNVSAVYDVGADAEVGLHDVYGTAASGAEVTVAGGQVAQASQLSMSASSTAAVTTSTYVGSGYSGRSNNFSVNSGVRVPVRVTLIAGSDGGVPQDLALSNQSWTGELQWSSYNNDTTTLAGQSFTFGVDYSDGTSEVLDRSISAILDPPTALSPVDAGSTSPTFSWAPGASTAASGDYQLSVQPADNPTGIQLWWTSVPLSTSSVAYDSDGRASQDPLTSGTSYSWDISVVDSDGNSATRRTTFVAQ